MLGKIPEITFRVKSSEHNTLIPLEIFIGADALQQAYYKAQETGGTSFEVIITYHRDKVEADGWCVGKE